MSQLEAFTLPCFALPHPALPCLALPYPTLLFPALSLSCSFFLTLYYYTRTLPCLVFSLPCSSLPSPSCSFFLPYPDMPNPTLPFPVSPFPILLFPALFLWFLSPALPSVPFLSPCFRPLLLATALTPCYFPPFTVHSFPLPAMASPLFFFSSFTMPPSTLSPFPCPDLPNRPLSYSAQPCHL